LKGENCGLLLVFCFLFFFFFFFFFFKRGGVKPSANYIYPMGVLVVDVPRAQDEVRISFTRWEAGKPAGHTPPVSMGDFRIGPFVGEKCGQNHHGTKAMMLKSSGTMLSRFSDEVVEHLREELVFPLAVLDRVYRGLNGNVQPLHVQWHLLFSPWYENEACDCGNAGCNGPMFRGPSSRIEDEIEVARSYLDTVGKLHPCYAESPLFRFTKADCFPIGEQLRKDLKNQEDAAFVKKNDAKVKRNDKCPCGSGKKAKNCCYFK
jgi:hypothetical protein